MTIDIELDDMATTLATIEKKFNSLEETLPQDKIYKANFVCEEILTNLKRHAIFEGRIADVTLSLEIREPEVLILFFQDNSRPFNLLTYPDPQMSLDIEEREIGGLGIFLTKKYAKILEYDYTNGYNILKVVL